MKISELIIKLQKAQDEHGDHPVFVRDHEVMAFRATPTKDGLVRVKSEEVNAIDVELY